MRTRNRINCVIYIAFLLFTSCATLRTNKKATQTVHAYKAPESDSVIVKVVASAVEPIEKFIELSASTLNPVSVGIGSAFNALGVGIGSALTIGPTGDHAVSYSTLTGYDNADIKSSATTIMLPTEQMAVKSGDVRGNNGGTNDVDKDKENGVDKENDTETFLRNVDNETDKITVTAPTLVYNVPTNFLQRVTSRSPLVLPPINYIDGIQRETEK